MTMMRLNAAVLGLALLVGTSVADSRPGQGASAARSRQSSVPAVPRVAITAHVVHISGQTVPYTATVADDIIMDNQSRPGAALVTIAYTRDGVSDLRHRPVMFIFNGGPGASSSPLHMTALGPVIRTNPKDRSATELAENTTSPLDITDLIFIDPVSTDPYYGVNFTANSQWVFAASKDEASETTAAIMARAMEDDSNLRLFAVSGIYDLGSSDGSGFSASGVPGDRLTVDLFPGPHEVYDGTDNRTEFDNDVRKFVEGAK
jgi:carboxypeptidase C (cathepsin A)